MAQRMLTTKEAGQIVSLLLATPTDQRHEQWPGLLTLLHRWSTTAAGAGAAPPRPVKPWELKQPQQQHQPQPPRQEKQKLLQQASAAVQLALRETAEQALNAPQGPAAAALVTLFVPAVLFLSAAVAATDNSDAQRQELRSAVVAAACEAAAALAAAPTAALLAAGGQQQQSHGLPAVVSSCKALLLSCMGVPSQAAWLVSSLLAALHAAVPNMLQAHMQQQQLSHRQQQHHHFNNVRHWLLEQAQQSAACSVLVLLGGLYQLGQDLGAACCKAATAAAPAAAATTRGGSPQLPSRAATASSSLHTLSEVAAVLVAGCTGGCDPLLQGLAASVAAGCCAGLLLRLPQGASAAALAGRALHDPQQPLLQQARGLLTAVQAAAGSCCCTSNSSKDPATPFVSPAAEAAAAAVGQGLLGQVCGRLLSTCSHVLPGLNNSTGPRQQQQQQQQQQQELSLQPELPALLLTLQYLTHHCCSLSGVYVQAAGCQDAAAANSWLKLQQQQHPAQEVGTLARWLGGAAAALPRTQLQQLLAAVSDAGVRLARSFSSYQLLAPAGVVAGVDAALLRQQLDRTFAMHVVLLADIWQAVQAPPAQQQPPTQHAGPAHAAPGGAPGAPDAAPQQAATAAMVAAAAAEGIPVPEETCQSRNVQAAVVAASLQDLAALQFCRVQLPAYMELLRGLVAALASDTDPSAADAFIAASLPCYNRLVQAHPLIAAAVAASDSSSGTGSSSSSRSSSSSSSGHDKGSATPAQQAATAAMWLWDSVTAAELSFLLPLLPVAVRAASKPAEAAAQVLPLVLLLLPHPLPAVAQAAHASFATLVAIAADMQQQEQQHEQQRTDIAAAGGANKAVRTDPQQQQQQEQLLLEVVQQAVPMHLERTLAALPTYGSLEGLSTTFYSLINNLPCGSALALLAVTAVADRAVQLATEAAAAATVESAAAASEVTAASGAEAAAVSDTGGVGGQEPAAAAANKLFELLVLAVQVGDYQLLPTVLRTVASAVLAAPPSFQQQWLAQLYAGCLAVGDYTRKPALLEWFNTVQAQLLQQRGQTQRGKDAHVLPPDSVAQPS